MANLKEPKEITEPFGFVGGQMLTDLLAKGPDAITKDEREILRARKSYLTNEQIRKFGVDEPEEAVLKGTLTPLALADDDSEENEPESEPESEKEPSDKKKNKKKGRK